MMTIYIYLLLFIYWYIFSLFFSHLCFCLPKSLWKVFEGSHCVICLYPYLLPSWILSRYGGRRTLRATAGTRLAEPMEWGVCLDKHSPCPWKIINLHPPCYHVSRCSLPLPKTVFSKSTDYYWFGRVLRSPNISLSCRNQLKIVPILYATYGFK